MLRLSHTLAVVFGSYFLSLPVHACGSLVIDLHSVHSDIALTGFWIARYDARERDEAAGVFGPALQDGKFVEGEIVTADDFFARSAGNYFRKELPHLCKHGQHLYFVEEALRGFYVDELADAVGDFVEFVDFEREIHAARGAELVDEDLCAGMAFNVLEKQRWAAGRGRPASVIVARHLGDAVSDLGDLENGIDFGTDFF